MSAGTEVLENVRIASPCNASWQDMEGDERVRFCGLCKLNVYNISAMSREEAEALIAQKEGRQCLRLCRRADGTILTRDCPVGLFAVRRRLAVLGAGIAGMIAFVPGGLRLMEPLRGMEPFRSILNVVSRPKDVYVQMGTRITSTS